MAVDWQNGLFGLPPGADFTRDFVDGLLRRLGGQPPEALAQVTIYANSGRTLARLRAAFDARGPLLPPRIRLIGDLGARLQGAVTAPLARRLELGDLVLRLIRAQPDLASQSVPDLALSLAQLMGEMQSEGCGPDALDRIEVAAHAAHWQRALQFLRIAAGFYLDGPPQDREARQRLASEQAVRDWAEGRNLPDSPVIVAGSTGSHGATRLFMEAVAKLPNGAVVLPGFDFHQPQQVWDRLDARMDDHPQARFAPLIRAAGAVRPWAHANPPESRNRLISLALRPAPVTDQWIAEGPALPDLAGATAPLTLIEASQPQEEADAIAILIRDAVERGQAITLISADALLLRRVTAALDRWGILPDDSAGQPLGLSAPGLLLRQIASLFGRALTIDTLLILLKHPLTATGGDMRNDHLRMTRDLELRLRRHGPAFPDGPSLRAWADRGDETRKRWAGWLADLLDRIAPLAADRAARPLAERLADHRALTEALAAGPGGTVGASRLWLGDGGEAARAVMDHLAEHAGRGHPHSAADYEALLSGEFEAKSLRPDVRGHILARFSGPREARTEAVGLVVMAGLNEGGWPRALTPDPWLSRQMRLDAGLTLPERLIGLAAHDFQQAIAAEHVVLTRARRDAEAETIPSRWLNRILNLLDGLPDQGGRLAVQAMRLRGARWLDLARALRRADPVPPAPRPSPIPPPPALDELSVTEVRTLIRDPYAVYARRVLGLRPLDPLRAEPGAAMRGQVLHLIAERFLRDNPPPDASTPPGILRERFLRLTAEVLAENVPWPSARIFWQARMAGIADRLIADEIARLHQGTPAVVESRGSLPVAGFEFRLTAKPDRIDRLRDGTAQIYDYKSGKPPSDTQIELYDKQLPLEAAMVERGAFPGLDPMPVAGFSYIRLGDEGQTEPRTCGADQGDRTWDGFVALVGLYLTGSRGFTAMRAIETRKETGDYDHLSRFGEWSLADAPDPRKVGHE